MTADALPCREHYVGGLRWHWVWVHAADAVNQNEKPACIRSGWVRLEPQIADRIASTVMCRTDLLRDHRCHVIDRLAAPHAGAAKVRNYMFAPYLIRRDSAQLRAHCKACVGSRHDTSCTCVQVMSCFGGS